MNEDDYQFNLRAMREALAGQAQKFPLLPGLVYRCLYDFVLEHGREYRPVPCPGKYDRGVRQQCYGNAITVSGRFGLKYVEGVALSREGQVIPHGWNADAGDALVDTTWLNTGLAYIGVEFSLERADDATWNGDGHVLNAEAQGYPVFRQRWQGEDYSLKWPFSDRLEAFRVWNETGIYHPPPSIMAWLKERPALQGAANPWPRASGLIGNGSHGGKI